MGMPQQENLGRKAAAGPRQADMPRQSRCPYPELSSPVIANLTVKAIASACRYARPDATTI
jgi:hypothetical protein